MGIIAEESIKRVLAATDIVELINSYVPLKRSGASWKGVCPFHPDTHPSMTVSPARQSFMCFACQTGGDALTFVMQYENIPFVEAVKKLADRAGIPLVIERNNPQEEYLARHRRDLVAVNKMAAEYFHMLLMKSREADHARAYLNSRGLGRDIARRWKIGWAPAQAKNVFDWANEAKIPPKFLEEIGLLARGEDGKVYCRFRDRLMFPVCNERGECVAFSGRILGPVANTGKYINTPETLLFRKREVLFGLDRARMSFHKMGKVVLCEGQLDVISCHEAGQTCVVAPLGTALTADHARLLTRYKTKKVILCFDADRAGMSAADKAFRLLAAEGFDIYLAELPEGEDPDSFIRNKGGEVFGRYLDEAKSFFEARINRARKLGQLESTTGRAEVSRLMVDLLAYIKDPIARELASADVATRLRMGLDTTQQEVSKAVQQVKRESRTAEKYQESVAQPAVPIRALPLEVDRSIVILCEMALADAEIQQLLVDRFEDLVDPMKWIPGGALLRKILQKTPIPQNQQSLQEFFDTLTPEEQEALRRMNITALPLKNLPEAVEEACGAACRIAIEKQQDAILAELRDDSLSPEKKLELLQQSVDLHQRLIAITPK